MPYVVQCADGSLLISLYVQPKASKTRVVGVYDQCLKLTVASPPIDGRANEELVRFFSEKLQIPKRSVELKSGMRGRRKVIRVLGVTAGELRGRLFPIG
jgi:uncharacterized protein